MKKPVSLILLFSLLSLFSADAYSEEKKKLYRWVDEQGNVHFSDEPQKGAESFEMKEVPATKMQKTRFPEVQLAPDAQQSGGSAATTQVYQSAFLSEPLNGSIVRNNAGIVTLSASLQPALKPGHSLRFFLDGKLVNKDPGATSVVVEKVSYEQHKAYFIVVNSEGGQIQTSETVDFQLMHIINPKIRKKQQGN